MPRGDGRIEPGQRISSAISARAWNRAQQAADIVLGANTGVSAGPAEGLSAPYTWVYAQNDADADISRWDVLKITGLAIEAPSAQFLQMPVLTVDDTMPTKSGEWCVAIEPIATGKIGRVAVAGVVQLRVEDMPRAKAAVVVWTDTFEWSLIRFGGETVRVGKTTSAWLKGTLATIEVYEEGTPPSETRNEEDYQVADCINKFSDVESGKWVIVAKAGNGRWYLISAEC